MKESFKTTNWFNRFSEKDPSQRDVSLTILCGLRVQAVC